MTQEEAERVAELVDTLASARTALEGCVRAMRAMPGNGGMPAIQANGTANRITIILNRAQQEPFIVDMAVRDADGE